MAEGKKPEGNARARRAAERAAQGITQKEERGSFLQVEEIRQQVETIVQDQFQLALEKLQAKGSGNNRTLEIVLDYPADRTDSLSLDTVAEVSQAISAALDQADDGSLPYLLEVSSRGVTSPLTAPRHWQRSIGRLINIQPDAGESFLARLDEVTEAGPVIRRKKNTKKGQPESYREPETLDWQKIYGAKAEIEFNR